jgi:hypothetical protein
MLYISVLYLWRGAVDLLILGPEHMPHAAGL